MYQVSGSVGQPDAGATMSGGTHSVDGGSWSIIAVVPTPGAPSLTVTLPSTNTAVALPAIPDGAHGVTRPTKDNQAAFPPHTGEAVSLRLVGTSRCDVRSSQRDDPTIVFQCGADGDAKVGRVTPCAPRLAEDCVPYLLK